MTPFLAILKKEFLQFRRNKFLPRLVVMMPVALICIAPFILNMEVKNVKVAVVDDDRSPASRQLISRIDASSYFILCGTAPSHAEAISLVENAKADIVLDIPRHYGRDLALGQNPTLAISANAVNGAKGSLGANYLNQIIQNQNPSSFKLLTSYFIFNPSLSYRNFFIPALLAMIIILLCGFLPALNVVGEKEKGSLEQINVTPVSKLAFILAKLIPYWVMGLVVATLSVLLAWLVWGLTPTGSLAMLYLLVVLFSVVVSAFGLVVSNYSNNLQQAMFVMWFFVVIFLLLSGLFTPVESMPQWAQTLTLVNPMRYFNDAIRTVYLRSGTFAHIYPHLAVLTGAAALFSLWAIRSYSKNN